ncbi:hypothetical protein Ndes2437A_g06053 [Nannochloris sp. 'desiccata']
MGPRVPRHYSGIGLLMFAGSLSNVVGKILYSLKSPGRDDLLKPFSKPWFSTTLTFVGMFICLPCSLVWRLILKRHSQQPPGHDGTSVGNNRSEDNNSLSEESQPLLDRENNENNQEEESSLALESMAEASVLWWRKYDAVLFPTFFDLLASGLLSIGLLYTSASLYQMLRGTEIIFTAVLSVFVLHRHLNSQNILGLTLCALGLSIVGYSGLLSSKGPQNNNNYDLFSSASSSSTPVSQTLLGIFLIIAAEAVQALQIVAEDFLMSAADTQIPPIEVVGYEGAFGLIILTIFLLPALQFSRFGKEGKGLQEDSIESILMVSRSPQLLQYAVVYVALMAAYNLAGMVVTESMGALSRTIAETLRTLLVWTVDLCLYYKLKIKGAEGGHLGEPWTQYSWIQLLGFVIMVLGTACYAAGEEKHTEELKACLQRRARERWAVLRITMPRLLELSRREEAGLSLEERRIPVIRPARIAGPARIRVALALMQLRKKLKRRQLHRHCVGDGGT